MPAQLLLEFGSASERQSHMVGRGAEMTSIST
jgi:hypothetical protein